MREIMGVIREQVRRNVPAVITADIKVLASDLRFRGTPVFTDGGAIMRGGYCGNAGNNALRPIHWWKLTISDYLV